MQRMSDSDLWRRCRNFVEEQSAGEWDDKTIADDADKLLEFVMLEVRSAIHSVTERLPEAQKTL
jgi:hypothetical protein